MRKLRFFGAVAVVAVLVATFASLSLLPNSASAGKPEKTKPCSVETDGEGEVHYHGRNVHGTEYRDIIDCTGYGKQLHIYGDLLFNSTDLDSGAGISYHSQRSCTKLWDCRTFEAIISTSSIGVNFYLFRSIQ